MSKRNVLLSLITTLPLSVGGIAYAVLPNANINVSSLKASVSKGSTSTKIHASKYKSNEVIVKYKKTVNLTNIASQNSIQGLIISNAFNALSKNSGHTFAIAKSKSLSTEALIKKFQLDPNVEYVEPNYIYQADATPNDPSYNLLWGQHNTGQSVGGTSGTSDADIDAPEAWDTSTGSSDVVIAVIDTGVDYLHEDLADNMWQNPGEIPGNKIDDDNNGYIDDVYGIDAANNTGDPMDKVDEDGGHGTHVAGTIAAKGNNAKGVVGVSWNSKIMALKFLSTGGGSSSDAIECLDYIIAQKNAGVNIVASNNSWGGGGYSQALIDAIEASNDAGILFLAAAGNDGVDNDVTPHYPSSYDLPGIISVAATDSDDTLASFSNYGATSVDLSAPGTNILSSTPGSYTPSNGDIFFDDMESGMGNWTTGGTNNTWAISEDQELFENPNFPVPSPTHFLSDSPGSDYLSNTDSWIMLNHNIDLSSTEENVYIAIGSAEYIEGTSDHATIEISKDGGSNWSTLFDFTGYAKYWVSPYSFQVPDDFKTSAFRVRFHLTSDGSAEYAGWLIDNVGIGTNLSSTYSYLNGTSMATPQVSGAVALRASSCPKDTLEQLRDAVLETIDLKDDLTGKVSTQGRLNANNLIDRPCSTANNQTIAPVMYLLLN